MTWYKYQHPKAECYKQSEKLVQLVSIALQRHFVHIFLSFIKNMED